VHNPECQLVDHVALIDPDLRGNRPLPKAFEQWCAAGGIERVAASDRARLCARDDASSGIPAGAKQVATDGNETRATTAATPYASSRSCRKSFRTSSG
jgi:hypothetical protein